ncbi:MAG: hypothetical protein JWN14_1095 [Chthonomonadales bacterium]|nr:hypothetical protein [Chthonomonadales bacterium]
MPAKANRLMVRRRRIGALQSAASDEEEIDKHYAFWWLDNEMRTVGVSLPEANIIFHPWVRFSSRSAPREGEPDPEKISVKAVADLAHIVYDLRSKATPNGGTPYVPTEILVQFEVWGRRGTLVRPHPWPLADSPLPAQSIVRRYSGRTARILLTAMQKGQAFTDGKHEAIARWRPVLDAPYIEQPYEREEFTVKKWDGAQEGAVYLTGMKPDGTLLGQNGMLYRWNMVKDLLAHHLTPGQSGAEVSTLLGRPDNKYTRQQLLDLGIPVLPNATKATEWNISGLHMEPSRDLFLVLYFDRKDHLLRAQTMVH